MRKTNPIWPARPEMGAGWQAAMSRRSAIAQNEANSGVKRPQWMDAAAWRPRRMA
jgi:hypothetical protein